MLAVPPVDQASKTELNQAKKSLLMYVTKCNQLEEILDQDLGQIDPADLNKQVVSKLSLEIQHLKTELSNVQAQRDELLSQRKRGGKDQLEMMVVELKAMIADLQQLFASHSGGEQEQKQTVPKAGKKLAGSEKNLLFKKSNDETTKMVAPKPDLLQLLQQMSQPGLQARGNDLSSVQACLSKLDQLQDEYLHKTQMRTQELKEL